MHGTLFFTLHQVRRIWRRSAAVALALALAVGLAGSILLYIDASAKRLTNVALRSVPVDLVAHGTTERVNPVAIAADYQQVAGVRQAIPLTAMDFMTLKSADGTKSTAPGKLFSVTQALTESLPFVAISSGSYTGQGLLLTEASAIQLGVQPGQEVVLTTIAGSKAYPVTGIVKATPLEPLFTSGDPSLEGLTNLTPDVVIMPQSLFEADIAPAVQAATAGASGAIALAHVDPQVYVQLNRSAFATDPATSQRDVRNTAFSLERRHTGMVRITNNDEVALKRAQQDIVGAKILFIFLGIPGVAVAMFLAHSVSQVFQEESRRDIGLLRVRGANPRQILMIAALSALLPGLAGSLAGVGLAWLGAGVAGGLGSLSTRAVLGVVPYALAAGLLLTLLAVVVPTVIGLRREITAERRRVSRDTGHPIWQRYGFDLLALGCAAFFFLVSALNGGFKPTTAEGQSISLAFYVFLGPLFLWMGLTLLLQRLIGRSVPRLLAALSRVLRLGGFGAIASKDMARRPAIGTAATTVIALTVAFALSVTAFTATYQRERLRDSRYVAGADVRVTVTSQRPGADAAVQHAVRLPSVTGVSGFMRDVNALVGAQKQTVYGIDVGSFRTTASVPDSFIRSGKAASTLDALAATPNGVLVGRDEAIKFNILVGDPLLVRLSQPGSAAFTDLTLRVVGIENYFPTSSQDSDFIMNRALMATSRPGTGNDVYLLKTTGDPAAVSAAVRAALTAAVSARVEDRNSVAKVDQSSLTSLNVAGLGAIERIYSSVFAAGILLVFVSTLLAQRRKEYSTMRALGASLGQVRRILVVQSLAVVALAVVVGVAVGTVMGEVLVRLLAIVFTLPAGRAVIASQGAAAVLIATAAGTALAIGVASTALARSSIATVLREE